MAHFLKCSLLGHCQHFFIVSLETGWYFSAASARLMHFFVFVSQISVAELHFVQISLLSMPWDALVGHSIHLLDVALSNAIFPSFAPHGVIHSPLRLIVLPVQFVGSVHGVSDTTSPQALVFLW